MISNNNKYTNGTNISKNENLKTIVQIPIRVKHVISNPR